MAREKKTERGCRAGSREIKSLARSGRGRGARWLCGEKGRENNHREAHYFHFRSFFDHRSRRDGIDVAPQLVWHLTNNNRKKENDIVSQMNKKGKAAIIWQESHSGGFATD